MWERIRAFHLAGEGEGGAVAWAKNSIVCNTALIDPSPTTTHGPQCLSRWAGNVVVG
jgi:hypothetical protein